MSTAALSAPHLEVTAPDTMDLHSEDGLDFDDGDVDIDIDLDLRSPGGVEDDESLRDAGTDAGQDVQAVPGDLDDFMADNEDLIEEDIIDEDVEVDIRPQSAEHTTVLDQSPPPGPEEDLIDYSDDEDAAAHGNTVTTNVPQTDALDEPVIALENGEQARDDGLPRHESHAGEDDIKLQQGTNAYQSQTELDPVQTQDLHATQQPSDASVQPGEQSHAIVHDELRTEGQETHNPERGTRNPTIFSATTGVDNSSTEQGGQDDENSNFHPVNVNFNAKDYWLFQHHDYEGSGDYLLEDDSFLKQPLNSVINACREALGALDVDVPGDFELGFCLDSLHQIELFEEHSTCAFFSLNDILRVYLQLYAQDGITDPEYFCITLVSRPRVSFLLAELSRAASEGIGYSGLDNVIASGQSLFSVQKSHSPSEHDFGAWEGDEEQEVPKVHDHSEVGDQAGLEEEHQGHYEHEDAHGSYEEQSHGDEDWQHESNDQHEPEPELEPEFRTTADDSEKQTTAAVTVSGNAVSQNTKESVKEDVEQPITDSAVSEQFLENPDENFLDYSDDEYEEDAPGDQAQASRVSSASATVQGDDPPQTQDCAENVAQNKQQSEHPMEGSNDGQAASGADALTEYEGNDYSHEEFDGQAYGETYEEYEQEYTEDQEAEGYPGSNVAQANVEDTNHLGDREQQLAEDADGLDVNAESYVGENDVVDDTFEGLTDILELGDTAAVLQKTVKHDAAEDELDYSDDEEDGVVGQALAAASAAADTVVTSSTEPRVLSPQGQKRTIDEVGNDVVDAITPTDAKRPRV